MKTFDASLGGREQLPHAVLPVVGGSRRPGPAGDDPHHEAHARCYIASSLRGEVVVKEQA